MVGDVDEEAEQRLALAPDGEEVAPPGGDGGSGGGGGEAGTVMGPAGAGPLGKALVFVATTAISTLGLLLAAYDLVRSDPTRYSAHCA